MWDPTAGTSLRVAIQVPPRRSLPKVPAIVALARGSGSTLLAPAVFARAETAQQPEAVDARAVAVAPDRGDRIVAHAREVHELLVAQLQVARLCRMALAACAGAPAPQVVEG